MRAFQSTYIGRHDFPKSLPDFLLQQWFTFNARDRRAIRKAFRSRHWIGAALQLGFLGMTGTTLRSLEYVPAAVLRHLGRQFKQPVPDIATLRTLYLSISVFSVVYFNKDVADWCATQQVRALRLGRR